MKPTLREVSLFVSLVVTSAAPANAQEPPMVALSPMNIEFMSAPIAFDNEPVTDAPYSAEAVTERAQILADGNRIVHQHKAQISRDGKGRTRREEGLATFGPLVRGPAGSDNPRHVQISDPNTRTTIILDLQGRTAETIPAPQFKLMTKGGEKNVRGAAEHFEVALPVPPPGVGAGGVQFFSARKLELNVGPGQDARTKVENLGTQFLEGVSVEGTRTTLVIPAGEIGNELPINVVSERWFSPELKVLVVSRQSDPRFGETTYRLTNLTRGEPAAELFEVPADFKVFDPAHKRDVIIERKIINK